MDVFVNNTSKVEVRHLRSAVDMSYIDDAAVTLTLFDADGEVVVNGEVTLEYLSGSNGDYVGYLSENAELVAGQAYTGVIEADGGDDKFARWELLVVAKVRTH